MRKLLNTICYKAIALLKSLLIVSLSLLACNSEVGKKMEPKGTALGKLNEIVVVADNEVWEGMAGDSFRYYFASAYPILPSPEPMFDLRHYTPQDLVAEPLRKELRTYVVLSNLADDESPTTRMVKSDIGEERLTEAIRNDEVNSSVGRDKWAHGQLLIYLYGRDEKFLSNSIVQNFEGAAKKVSEHDSRQLRQKTYARELHLGHQARIQDYFGLNLEVPSDFRQAKLVEEEPMLWLRKDTKGAIMNLVFKKIPYQNQGQFSKQNIIEMINEYGMTHIDSERENDFLVVNEDDLPVYEYTIDINGSYAKEIRGIWEMTNSFMGGPFTAHLISANEGKELVLVFSYVYAPGETKRDLIQQLDFMVKHMEI